VLDSGADVAVDHSEGSAAVVAAVKAATRSRGADVILEMLANVNMATVRRACDSTRAPREMVYELFFSDKLPSQITVPLLSFRSTPGRVPRTLFFRSIRQQQQRQ